jgi:hypothetical protein
VSCEVRPESLSSSTRRQDARRTGTLALKHAGTQERRVRTNPGISASKEISVRTIHALILFVVQSSGHNCQFDPKRWVTLRQLACSVDSGCKGIHPVDHEIVPIGRNGGGERVNFRCRNSYEIG